MKKLLLTLMACFAVLMAQAWTVTFTNPDKWPDVWVWAWDSNDNYTGGKWPGKEMVKDSQTGYYTYTGTGTPQEIIFSTTGNYNPKQTGNLTFQDGATYDMLGVVGAKTYEHIVYFKNEQNWSDVYAYCWSPEIKSYPGVKLSTNSEGLYVWTITDTNKDKPVMEGFQFNNGLSGDEEQKTKDITTWVEGATYLPDGSYVGQTPTTPDYSDWWVNIVGGFNSWENNGVQPNDENITTHTNLPIGTTAFKVKIWNGQEDVWLGNGNEIDTNEWVTIDSNTGDMTIAGATEGATYNVQFNVATNQIYIIPDNASQEPEPETPVTLYLVGDGLNGAESWDASDSYKMTYQEADEVYTWEGNKLEGKFKIFNGNWTDNDYNIGVKDGNATLTLGKALNVVAGEGTSDILLPENGYVENPVVTFDLDAMTVTVNGNWVSITPTYPEALYIVGNVNNTGWNSFIKCNTVANGVYTWTGLTIESGFKFTDSEGYTHELGSNDSGVELDKPYTYAEGGGNIIFAGDLMTVQNATVEVNLSTKTLTISGEGTYQEGPAVLYVRGTWNSYGTEDEMELTNDENVYTWTGNVAAPEVNKMVMFKIADSGWTKYNYGANDDESIAVYSNSDGIATLVDNGNDLAITNWVGGEMTITFNLETLVVTVAGANQPEDNSDSINSIQGRGDAEEIIYNLQGVRVNRNNLGKGLYIINGKKVMVK